MEMFEVGKPAPWLNLSKEGAYFDLDGSGFLLVYNYNSPTCGVKVCIPAAVPAPRPENKLPGFTDCDIKRQGDAVKWRGVTDQISFLISFKFSLQIDSIPD